MRKSILVTLILLFSSTMFSQDIKSLEERALKIYNHQATQQYDSIVNYIHPSIFRTISKKEFIDNIKNTSSQEITVSPVHTPPNFYFGEIKKVGENYYCIFYYDQTMKVKFHDELSKKESDYLIEYGKKRFRSDKVIFNAKMNALLLLTRMKEVAIADKENNYIWTFEPVISDRSIREQLGL